MAVKLGRGRPTIFEARTEGVHGNVTPVGKARLDDARRRLRALYREIVREDFAGSVISDGDAVEFLARGEVNTRKYLQTQK
jgi:hypothetical protein